MQLLLSKSTQGNRQNYLIALDTSSADEVPEECTITTSDGLTVTMTKGKKKKSSLFSTLLKKVTAYIEPILTLAKILFSLFLLLFPSMLQ